MLGDSTMIRGFATARVLKSGLCCVGLWAALLHPAVSAPKCSFFTASSVDFGTYNVFEVTPNNFGVGSIAISCQGGGGPFKVSLSTGQSHSFGAREMQSGTSHLSYNLYTTAARSVVWGDGSAASGTLSAGRNTTTRLDIFGQIPALQDAAIGTYTDSIVAIVNF
jgi:spore coat protein U-like protein